MRSQTEQCLDLASGAHHLVNVYVVHGQVVADVTREVGLRIRRNAVSAAYDVCNRFSLDLTLIMVALPAAGYFEFLIFPQVSQE